MSKNHTHMVNFTLKSCTVTVLNYWRELFAVIPCGFFYWFFDFSVHLKSYVRLAKDHHPPPPHKISVRFLGTTTHPRAPYVICLCPLTCIRQYTLLIMTTNYKNSSSNFVFNNQEQVIKQSIVLLEYSSEYGLDIKTKLTIEVTVDLWSMYRFSDVQHKRKTHFFFWKKDKNQMDRLGRTPMNEIRALRHVPMNSLVCDWFETCTHNPSFDWLIDDTMCYVTALVSDLYWTVLNRLVSGGVIMYGAWPTRSIWSRQYSTLTYSHSNSRAFAHCW